MKRPALSALIAGSLVSLAALATLGGLGANTPTRPASADFVVASSRDAGPGTLRDALLAADRLSSRAHIVITAKRITLDSALPALINPHGVEIDAAADAGVIDADRQKSGAVLQIDSPTSVLRGLHVINGHAFGIIVNAPNTRMESLTVSGSKIGILLTAAASGAVVRTSTLEHDETAVMAEAEARNLGIFSAIFRDNSRAGFWLVASTQEGTASAGAPEGRYAARIVDGVFEKNAAGVVIANRPTLVQKCRFIGTRDSAVLLLGGAARVEDSEIRSSGGTAISITSGTSVTIVHNTLVDNVSTAIGLRDTEAVVERNTLQHNGFGIVSVVTRGSATSVIRDNIITRTSSDAITLIGGATRIERNHITENHGAGLRALDLVRDDLELKVAPHLEANVFERNGIDVPPHGVYKLSGAL